MYVDDASAPGIAEMTSGTFDIKAHFEAGNIYTMINGDWMFRLMEADFEWGAAPLPIFDGEPEGSSVGQSSYLVISSNSKHPEEAYKFIEYYCTTPEAVSYTHLDVYKRQHQHLNKKDWITVYWKKQLVKKHTRDCVPLLFMVLMHREKPIL